MNSAGLAEFIRLNLRLYDVVSPAARYLCIATTCSNCCRNSLCKFVLTTVFSFHFHFPLIFFFISFQLQQRGLPRKNGDGSGRYPWLCSWTTKEKRSKKTGAISLYVVFLLCNSKREKKRRERRRRITRKKKIQKTGRGPHVRRQIFFRYQQAKSSGAFW